MTKLDAKKVTDFFENSYKGFQFEQSREKKLISIAKKIAANYVINNNEVNIIFICTHNSRRSQLGQVWSFFAARYFNLCINAFSGGTEVTAFHRNTIKTLRKVGFTFTIEEFCHQNPIFRIGFGKSEDSLLVFSKMYDHPINKTPYLALTTCDNAHENCPFIPKATHRFHLPYKDPKHSDETSEQGLIYLQTNAEIAAEMYLLFSEVKTLI